MKGATGNKMDKCFFGRDIIYWFLLKESERRKNFFLLQVTVVFASWIKTGTPVYQYKMCPCRNPKSERDAQPLPRCQQKCIKWQFAPLNENPGGKTHVVGFTNSLWHSHWIRFSFPPNSKGFMKKTEEMFPKSKINRTCIGKRGKWWLNVYSCSTKAGDEWCHSLH